MTESIDSMQERMANAIASCVDETDFVVKFLTLIEVVGEEGRAMWCVTSPDIAAWDILGMLNWALSREEAGSVLRAIGEAAEEYEEDDE